MNGFDVAENAISSYLAANWSEATAVLVLTNQEPPEEAEAYIKLTVQNAQGKNLSIGRKDYRYVGVIFVQIFTKPGEGTGRANEIGTALSNIFRDILIENVIRCKVPNMDHIGNFGNWFQSNFSVDYSREEY